MVNGPQNHMSTWCCDLSSCMETVMPVGVWVKRTADSVLFTCYEFVSGCQTGVADEMSSLALLRLEHA